MVNTFLVDSNIKVSAKCLDNKRLNKQKVEALSILRSIKYLQILGKYYNNPMPKDDDLVYKWIRTVVGIYKKESFTLLYKNFSLYDDIDILNVNNYIKVAKGKKLTRQAYNHNVSTVCDVEILLTDMNSNKKIKVNINEYVSLNDMWITIGYIYHPAILMWANYFDALVMYTQIHIEECLNRGFINNIKLIIKDNNPMYPSWIRDAKFLLSHRSNLIRKDAEWYQPIFPGSDNKLEYIWPFNNK